MMRQQLIQYIAASRTPVGTATLAAALDLPSGPESLGAMDLLLSLSPEVKPLSGGWIAAVDTRERRVLAALRSYAAAHPDKRIFRASAALGELGAADQMTEEQLRGLLADTHEFDLLGNAMIKRIF